MAGSIRQRSEGVWELRVWIWGATAADGCVTSTRRSRKPTALAERRVGPSGHAARGRAGAHSGAGRTDLGTGHHHQRCHRGLEAERLAGPQSQHRPGVRRSLAPETLRDSIGRRRIATLSPYDVERYFRDLKEGGAGYTTVRLARALLNRACRLARKWSGNVLPNPVGRHRAAHVGSVQRPKAVRSPEPAEVLALLEAARVAEVRVAVLIRLVAATGMRRGRPAPSVGTISTPRPGPS